MLVGVEDQARGTAAADRRIRTGERAMKIRRLATKDEAFERELQALTRFDAGESSEVREAKHAAAW
jgi:hypothetical protein